MPNFRFRSLRTAILSTVFAWQLFNATSEGCNMQVPHGENAAAVSTKRAYFYVGGHYENATQYGIRGDLVLRGQMYVDSLEPAQVTQKWPIVMIEGAGQTGANFLNTPDNRPGWADSFLSQGYKVYIVDQASRGRSATLPSQTQNLTMLATDYYTQYWTAPQNFNLWDQAKYYTQWPGTTGLPGDPVFDALYASHVQYLTNYTYQESLMQNAGLVLLEKIGPAILLTHSQAGAQGWGIADAAAPQGLVKAIVALEPIGPPFVDAVRVLTTGTVRPYGIATIPLTYDPPLSSPEDLRTVTIPPPDGANGTLTACIQQDPNQTGGVRKLVHLQGFPVLVVTSQASYHAPYDYCTVRYLRDAGVDVTWFDLPQMGIYGNGHFMFMERNNEVIAGEIGKWLGDSIK